MRWGEAGFSLLEILIALAIISSAVTIAVMNVTTLRKKAELVALEGRVRYVVELGRIEARATARPISLRVFDRTQTDQSGLIGALTFPQSASISSLGACNGFVVSAQSRSGAYFFDVEAITCRVSKREPG